jgi:VanZ family protein
MAVIFWLSAQPSLPRAPDDLFDTLVKKGAHFAEYVVLAILLARALATESSSRFAMAIAAAIAIGYAVSDELHQAVVPGRIPSHWDVGVDALGVISGVAVFAWWRVRR